MNYGQREPSFAPADITDGRKPGDWKSRYPDKQARRAILTEAVYLVVFLFMTPTLAVLIYLEIPKAWVSMEEIQYQVLTRYAYAWLGGTLGGTLFGMKWLYHSVAKRIWHRDRRLWRLFTPHISGGLGCAVVVAISSGVLRVFDQTALNSPSLSFAIGFLVGHFSDSAVAKLAEVAETLFGPTRRPKEEKPTRQTRRRK